MSLSKKPSFKWAKKKKKFELGLQRNDAKTRFIMRILILKLGKIISRLPCRSIDIRLLV